MNIKQRGWMHIRVEKPAGGMVLGWRCPPGEAGSYVLTWWTGANWLSAGGHEVFEITHWHSLPVSPDDVQSIAVGVPQ